MFKHLRTKLTVLYAGLFGCILLATAAASYAAMSTSAAQQVRRELTAGAASFDHIWSLRADYLAEGASVLAKDFGFREALATGDDLTVQSALDNLRSRQKLDLAILATVDGATVASGAEVLGAEAVVRTLLEGQAAARGAVLIKGRVYQAVAEPVFAPDFRGMVIFALELDAAELSELGRSSAISLTASLHVARRGGWPSPDGRAASQEAALSRAIDNALRTPLGTAQQFRLNDGDQIAVAKTLQPLDGAGPVVLLLRYPLAPALAPLRQLMSLLLAIGCGALVLVLLGGWGLASSVTNPLQRLDRAAGDLSRGEMAEVRIGGRDEIAHLAERFNLMASEIRARESAMRADAVALAVALDQAQAANRQSQAFLANMSHELRTPLNGVLGLSCVLEQLVQDPAQREMAAAIAGSAGEMERLATDLLEAARLNSGSAEAQNAPFDLRAVLRGTAEYWRSQAETRGLAFSTALADETAVAVTGDPESLRRILDALLENAVKFTERGSVRLEAVALDDDRWRFSVLDTGLGFSPERRETIFAPFTQADDTNTRRFGGAGVGLSNARGLAELMGGDLSGDGRVGEGAAFHLSLRLPRIVEQVARAA